MEATGVVDPETAGNQKIQFCFFWTLFFRAEALLSTILSLGF
jgi:hypothetical protein